MKNYEEIIRKIANTTKLNEKSLALEKALVEFNEKVEQGIIKKRETILPNSEEKDKLRYLECYSSNINLWTSKTWGWVSFQAFIKSLLILLKLKRG